MKSLTKFLLILIVFYAGSRSVIAQTTISRISDDLFEIQINDSCSVAIRILQFTDLHLGKKGFRKQDSISFKRIKKLVQMYDPHLIAITGDMLTEEKPFGNSLAAFCWQFFDSLERPWLYVFGNHDHERGFGHDRIYKVFHESSWGVLGFHAVTRKIKKKYDYAVKIKTSLKAETKWIIYGFDSGAKKGFKSIKTDQLLWYKNISQKINPNKKARAISIFHIPLKQYQDLWDDKNILKHGESKEKVCFEEDDGSVYDAFVKRGEIEATFCGHDHYNNYWGTYRGGIILAYGYISGEATKWAWPTGGKLITLPLDGGEINIENVIPEFE